MTMLWKLSRLLLASLWLGLCAYLLALGLAGLRESSDPRNLYNTFVFYQGMRVVAFPLGLVAWYLVYGFCAFAAALNARPSPELQMWVTFIAVAAVGYVQWFHLAPRFIRQILDSRKRARLQLH
jgi:hypothetical protein